MRPRSFVTVVAAVAALAMPAGCSFAPATGSSGGGARPAGASHSPSVAASKSATPTPKPKPVCEQPAAPAPVPTKVPKIGPTSIESNWRVPKGHVLITVDDRGSSSHVNGMMDLAIQTHTQLVFFATGTWAKQGHAGPCATLLPVVQRMYREGFYVGNHAWQHPSGLMHRSSRFISGQIAHGVHSNCFRPPEGSINRTVRALAARQGYRLCHWTYDTRDWSRLSADQLVADLRATLADPKRRWQLDGGVILIHMLDDSNIFNVKQAGSPDKTALAQFIAILNQAGIHPCRLVRRPVGPTIPSPMPCA